MLDMAAVRQLPAQKQAELFEDEVITIMLGSPDVILKHPLDLRWFPRWHKVVEVMLGLSSRGLEVGLTNIASELGGDVHSWYQSLGGLVRNYYTSVGYEGYLKKLREKYEDITIYRKLQEGSKSIAAGSSSRDVLGGLVNDSLSLLSTAEERQDTFSASDMVKSMIDRLATVMDSKGDKHLGVSTGLSKLDFVLGGLHPSDLCVIAGRPGSGKTAFALTMLLHALRKGLRVGFFSSEMSVDQVMFRFSAQMAHIDAALYRRADFDEDQLTRLTSQAQVFSKFNIRVCDKTSVRVSEIALRSRAWAMDGGLDLIVVDYLQRIHPDKDSGNRNLDVGDIAVSLKNLARDLNVPVVALAQLNRGNMNRAEKKPRMSDIRDSGIVEQEADSILLLYRSDENDIPCASVIVDKNRHGEAGVEAVVNFDPRTMRWFCDGVGGEYE
jgi:replicative DNA helicase